MDKVNVTLLVAIISAAVALYGYFYTKKKEREFTLAKTRQEIYQLLITNLSERIRLMNQFGQDPNIANFRSIEDLYAYIFKNNPELSKNFTEAFQINTMLCIYGTDDAVRAAAKFQRESAEYAQQLRQMPSDLPKLVLTLRKNVFSGFSDMKNTKVSKEDIGQLMTM
ncbi:MAG TPA: hypothetical protein PLK94_10940 [Alphaproteobacteria bacterium]|nr:hypothetical protein [Alphaproteobacteria bacterium]HPQ45252.1 hypothetical protein [Syntrophales bacterium]